MGEARVIRLQRHQLVQLAPAGWAQLLARDWAEPARACLAHWAAQGLPLVVTRQPEGLAPDLIQLGLPAPTCWGRLRLTLQADRADVLGGAEFPGLDRVAQQWPAEARAPWLALCSDLAALQVRAQVYGSHGWQHLTGLAYVHERSDLDLFMPVASIRAADAVAALLAGWAGPTPRLDGELGFADGAAVAWREWLHWRQGRVEQLLVKRLHDVTLQSDFDLTGPV